MAQDLLEYLKENNQDDLKFVDDFWGIIPTKKDKETLKNFLEVVNLHNSGLNISKISKSVGISESTISKWIYKMHLPIIIRIIKHSMNLADSKKGKLLSLNSTRGGLLTGPWIYVPEKIHNYDEIKKVINQLTPSPEVYKKLKEFDINKIFFRDNRDLFFAYLLGIMIGDAGKHGFQRQHRFMRRISLKLSKKHETNERLGEFVGLCMNGLGLRYSQVKDVPPSRKNKFYFYSWNSQSSLLISWMMESCFGLSVRDRTSYDPIKAEWILNSPKNFRIWFLQGVADSDGYIDINTFQAGIVSKPNIKFIQKVLDSLNIKSKISYLHKGSLYSIRFNLKDAYKLPIFNPYVKLFRYN